MQCPSIDTTKLVTKTDVINGLKLPYFYFTDLGKSLISGTFSQYALGQNGYTIQVSDTLHGNNASTILNPGSNINYIQYNNKPVITVLDKNGFTMHNGQNRNYNNPYFKIDTSGNFKALGGYYILNSNGIVIDTVWTRSHHGNSGSGGSGSVTSITPGIGFTNHTAITTSGTLDNDTINTLGTKGDFNKTYKKSTLTNDTALSAYKLLTQTQAKTLYKLKSDSTNQSTGMVFLWKLTNTIKNYWTKSDTISTLQSQAKTVNQLVLKANLASPTFTGTVSGITASMVGLGNLTNNLQKNANDSILSTGYERVGHAAATYQPKGTVTLTGSAGNMVYLNATNNGASTSNLTWNEPTTYNSGTLNIGNNFSGSNLNLNPKYGTEMYPGFSASNWVLQSGWDATNVGNTQLSHTSNGTGTATLSGVSAVIGQTYRVVITYTYSIASISYSFGGVTGSIVYGNGTTSDIITATSTAGLILTPTNNSRSIITYISIIRYQNLSI